MATKVFYLYNPLTHPVETTYDLDGTGALTTITIPDGKITEFTSKVLFDHAVAYLTTIILNERGLWHFDENRKQVRDEIIRTYD